METGDVARFLEALAQDCAGRQKQVAAEAFPTMSVATAEGEATNILKARRRPTVAFLLEAMADGERASALAVLAGRAGYRLERIQRDPAAVRAEVRDELVDLGTRIAAALQRMDDADAEERRLLAQHERRGPHRAVPAPSTTTRRHA